MVPACNSAHLCLRRRERNQWCETQVALRLMSISVSRKIRENSTIVGVAILLCASPPSAGSIRPGQSKRTSARLRMAGGTDVVSTQADTPVLNKTEVVKPYDANIGTNISIVKEENVFLCARSLKVE